MANFEGENFDRITIEPDTEPSASRSYCVYGHGVYERSSVLAGRPKRAFLEGFATLEEARASYPDAEVLEWSTKQYGGGESLADLSGLPSSPPDWFDPGAAGESWDDDY